VGPILTTKALIKKGVRRLPTTTIHISDDLLARIDEIVKKKGISRNRYIVQACEKSLKEDGRDWPKDFFDSPLNDQDLQLLRQAAAEMEKEILSHRMNREPSEL